MTNNVKNPNNTQAIGVDKRGGEFLIGTPASYERSFDCVLLQSTRVRNGGRIELGADGSIAGLDHTLG